MRDRLEFEIRRMDAVLAELPRGREGGVWYRP